MLRIFLLLLIFASVQATPAAAQVYYNAPGSYLYYHATPQYRHSAPGYRDVRFRTRTVRYSSRFGQNRAYDVSIHVRSYPVRNAPVYRPRRVVAAQYYVPAPRYYQPAAYAYVPVPTYAPAPTYRAAPRNLSQGALCDRIRNAVSRQACHCSIAFGGFAELRPNGQAAWSDPKGGGGILGLQQCKAAHAGLSEE